MKKLEETKITKESLFKVLFLQTSNLLLINLSEFVFMIHQLSWYAISLTHNTRNRLNYP